MSNHGDSIANFKTVGTDVNIIHVARDIAESIDLHIDPWMSGNIPRLCEAAVAVFGRPVNGEVVFISSKQSKNMGREIVQNKSLRNLQLPVFLNEPPASLPKGDQVLLEAQQIELLTIRGGSICNIGGSHAIIDRDGKSIFEDCSSPYTRLVYFYDFSFVNMVEQAEFIDGTVYALFIDAGSGNYCHWLIDFLPRLAHLGDRSRHSDVYVAIPPTSSPFIDESLRLCGFPTDRIIRLQDFTTLKARELIVLHDDNNFHHPAHDTAPWALDFLRSSVGLPAVVEVGVSAKPRKIYVSRADAERRRVINEPELMTLLSDFGYECIIPSQLSFREQVATFASATHIIGPHGAGLTNLIFSRSDSQLIELFCRAHGTPAYYLLCAGTSRKYFSYLSESPAGDDQQPIEDLEIDLTAFEQCARPFL